MPSLMSKKKRQPKDNWNFNNKKWETNLFLMRKLINKKNQKFRSKFKKMFYLIQKRKAWNF